MKKILVLCLLAYGVFTAKAQFSVKYNPENEPTTGIQYFKPKGNLFVGDCIPFFHKDTYYLYWLLDSAHHSALNGLGGHQWTLSTSKDLKNWKHHPVVLGIDEDWEKSICTGSIVYANNKFYAFYATRLVNSEGKVNEQLSYAISDDGINFKKQQPNPFYTSAPGYSKRDFRDPKAFVDDDGVFHLFVSSSKENAAIHANGSLVHMTSKDLKKWDIKEPVLTGQGSVPECPDYFLWNGWYYLIYGDNGNTFYVKSKSPYGPWQQPRYQAINEDWANVVKTAEFTNNRRISAGWVPNRDENKDNTREIFGGNIVLREITQEEDGTLSEKFPIEVIPETEAPAKLKLNSILSASIVDNSNCVINSPNGLGAANYQNVPLNSRITLEIEPNGTNEEYGLYLRSDEKASDGYKLSFSAINRTVSLGNSTIQAVDGLDKTVKIDIIMKDDIIDVSVDNKRCIVNRTPEQKGGYLWLFAKHGNVKFKSIKVSQLKGK